MAKIKLRTKHLLLTFSLILVLPGLMPVEAAQLKPGERLKYTLSYRGIFSGFIEMDIAHAEFAVESVADYIDGRKSYLTTLELTTQPYAKAEVLYPLRFSYRSWLEPDQQVPLLVDEYMQTDEISRELLWFDRTHLLGYRYEMRDTPVTDALNPPEFLLEKVGINQHESSFMERSNQQVLTDDEVWDYLSMFYRVRFLDLEEGKTFNLPLYNGKQIKHYRVEVSRERLRGTGWNRHTFKLSLYEIRQGSSKKNSNISVWISDDEQRLPLRLFMERALGAVEGILMTGRPPVTGRDDDFSEATRKSLELVF